MKKLYFTLLICLALWLAGCDTNAPLPESGASASESSSSQSEAPESSSQSETSSSSSSQSSSSTGQQPSSSSSSSSATSAAQSSSQPPQSSSSSSSSQTSQPPEEPKEETPPSADPYLQQLKKILDAGFSAGPPQSKFIYPVDSSWSSAVYNYDYDTPGQAHLSWKVSWILEGLDHAFAATRDRKYLDASIELYDALLAMRDDALGRRAWNGEIYPLWGSISRYNGAVFTLRDDAGNAAAKLTFHCQANDQTYVSVQNTVDGSFDLRIKHQDKVYTLNGLTLGTLEARVKELKWTYYGSPLPGKQVVEAVVQEGAAPPVAQGDTLVENTNIPTVIHSALILEPMVNTYIEMKALGHPQTQHYKEQIELMFDTLLRLHWNAAGYFAECKNSPTHLGGGYIVPWNQQLPLVSAMATYAKAENNAYLKTIVQKATRYFMTKVTSTGTGYLWRYWEDPSKTVTYYETTNYGGIDLSSIAAIYKTGLGFTEKDMQQFATTIRARVLKTPASPATRIDGSSPSSANTALLYRYLPFNDRVPAVGTQLKKATPTWDNAARLLHYLK